MLILHLKKKVNRLGLALYHFYMNYLFTLNLLMLIKLSHLNNYV